MRNQTSILKQYLKILGVSAVLFPLRILPVKRNRVLLVSWMGYRYADNCRYVAEYLYQNYPDLEVCFAVKKDADLLRSQIPEINFLQFGSLEYFLCAMTCRVFVTDGGGVSYIPFRQKQTVVDTWHGGGAYKLVGIPALGDTKLVRRYTRHDAGKYDIYLSTCKAFSHFFHEAKMIPRDVFFEVGMPRNDLLIHPDKKLIQKVSERLNLGSRKVVLYAPTFRDYEEDVYAWKMNEISFSVSSVLASLEERFGGEWVFLYRGHPNAASMKISNDLVRDVTDYSEMQELLLIADVMITDYSSSVWDFALTGKPGFLYTPDLEKYKAFRSFRTPIETWAFPLCKTEADLLAAIDSFSESEHRSRVEAHLQMMGNCETGRATELLGSRIAQLCQGDSD